MKTVRYFNFKYPSGYTTDFYHYTISNRAVQIEINGFGYKFLIQRIKDFPMPTSYHVYLETTTQETSDRFLGDFEQTHAVHEMMETNDITNLLVVLKENAETGA